MDVNENQNFDSLCLLCCIQTQNVLVQPCGHSNLCFTCALNRKLKGLCPFCRSPIIGLKTSSCVTLSPLRKKESTDISINTSTSGISSNITGTTSGISTRTTASSLSIPTVTATPASGVLHRSASTPTSAYSGSRDSYPYWYDYKQLLDKIRNRYATFLKFTTRIVVVGHPHETLIMKDLINAFPAKQDPFAIGQQIELQDDQDPRQQHQLDPYYINKPCPNVRNNKSNYMFSTLNYPTCFPVPRKAMFFLDQILQHRPNQIILSCNFESMTSLTSLLAWDKWLRQNAVQIPRIWLLMTRKIEKADKIFLTNPVFGLSSERKRPTDYIFIETDAPLRVQNPRKLKVIIDRLDTLGQRKDKLKANSQE